MKAKQRVCEERVQRGPAAVPVISKLRMCAVPRDAKLFPLLNVCLGDVSVCLGVTASI
jgi:hypothetical protein